MAQISPNIFRVHPDWHTSVPQQEFDTIQEAIDNVPAWGKYKILLEGDFADQTRLMLTEENTQITIDGQNQFSIDFRTGEQIVQMDSQKSLKFKNLNRLRGDRLIIRDDSTLYLENILNTMLILDIVDGKYVNVYLKHINLWGAERDPAVNMYNADSKLYIYDSFIKGGERCPALYFNTASEDKVKLKNSVILNHAVGGAPIEKRSGVDVSIRAYNCFGDTVLCSHDITNIIDEAHHNCMFNSELNF